MHRAAAYCLPLVFSCAAACGAPSERVPPPETPTAHSPVQATVQAELPANPEPAIWAAARIAQDGVFALPAGFTGTPAVDEVMEGVSVTSAHASWDAGADRPFGHFGVDHLGEDTGRALIRRIAEAAGAPVRESSYQLIVDGLDVSLSRSGDGWQLRHYAFVSSEVARERARALWASVPRARVLHELIAVVGARLETVTVRANADGGLEIQWSGVREGFVESDPLIAAARRAQLVQPELDSPLEPGTTVTVSSGLERAEDGYRWEVGLIPSFGSSSDQTELLCVVRTSAQGAE